MGLFRRRGGARLLEEGAPARGRVIAIEVVDSRADTGVPYHHRYAVQVDGGPLAGVVQGLEPAGLIRLGMEVEVRHDGERVAIDWRATVGGRPGSIRAMGKPPEPGIRDELLALDRARKRSDHGTGVIRAIAIADGRLAHLRFEVEVSVPGHEAFIAEAVAIPTVPHYATHLPVVGARLPVLANARDRRGVQIDWVAAAEADPGVGRPPAPDVVRLDPDEYRIVGISA